MYHVLAALIFTIGAVIMSLALDRLKNEVAETRGVAASAVAALTAIPQIIRDAVAAAVANAEGDARAIEQEMNTLADQLDAIQAPLAGAINQNPAETDTVVGDVETDTLPAFDGDDTLNGGDVLVDDTLLGDNGADTLVGGEGNDAE